MTELEGAQATLIKALNDQIQSYKVLIAALEDRCRLDDEIIAGLERQISLMKEIDGLQTKELNRTWAQRIFTWN